VQRHFFAGPACHPRTKPNRVNRSLLVRPSDSDTRGSSWCLSRALSFQCARGPDCAVASRPAAVLRHGLAGGARGRTRAAPAGGLSRLIDVEVLGEALAVREALAEHRRGLALDTVAPAAGPSRHARHRGLGSLSRQKPSPHPPTPVSHRENKQSPLHNLPPPRPRQEGGGRIHTPRRFGLTCRRIGQTPARRWAGQGSALEG
jgi:hypothetical protein